MDRGFTLVRPLEGGLDAWEAAGYDLEAERILMSPTGSFPRAG
jgi:3-mercaptopyruvate sulfurtransferase SseA